MPFTFKDSNSWWKEIPFEFKGYMIIKHLGPQFVSFPGINGMSEEQIHTMYTKNH